MKDSFVEAFTYGIRVDLLSYALRCHCARFHIWSALAGPRV